MMNSLVCIEPGKWQYSEIDTPVRKNDEALLKIKCVGICGTDLHAFQGNQPFFSYPRVLGHEFAAEVVEVNENEYGIQQGDLVTTIPYISCGKCMACRKGATNCCSSIEVLGVHKDGAMQEFMAVPVSLLVKVNGLTQEETALVECLSIGAHAVRRADVKPGEKVIIIGAGPIGISALQFAKSKGADVIMVDINQERLDYCETEFGVVSVNGMSAYVRELISNLTNGEMADTVIDATGNSNSMVEAIQYCGHAAKLVYVGLSKNELSFLHTEIHKRELTLLCSRNATREDFENVVSALKDGSVKSSCMITHYSSFSALTDDFANWLKKDSGVIKAMVKM